MKKFLIRIGITIVSPILYGLTNNTSANPKNISYFEFFKCIWMGDL